ncbi:MAG: isoleucine--tRNA ligase [Acholeplasmataceae bacterium]|nr:isoleucine--tRNA ligase [Acholeplasmataceae bacterium]
MDYKDTIILPKTDFPMRGNLGQKEPLIQEKWYEIKLYEKALEQNIQNEEFIFHDGPPYANGDVHAGTGLNKVLKDFILRFKTMQGYHVRYIPGWDTHGLPIESAIAKKGISHKKLSKNEFREKCGEFALLNVERQKAQFKRLGILGEWDNPYLTLNKSYEAAQIKTFGKLVSKGLIYRGLKPVYWSYSSETALAEAEIEYHDLESYSIYVSFPIVLETNELKDANLIIWTTTPWTLPGNLAVAVNPKFVYDLVKFNNQKYLIEHSLLAEVLNILKVSEYETIKSFKGQDLEFVKYKHPLYDKVLPIILGDHVTDETGTGLVHTAPGHGTDDYKVGQKYNLDILSPIDGYGVLTKEAGEFAGLFYQEADEVIVKKLAELGFLLNQSKFIHSYPHDWRTNKPVIFRATPQWFFSIDPIRVELLENIAKVEWKPRWGELRLSNMIKDREDWCISRQRIWGVPIPIFYAEDNEPILDQEVINHVSKLFEEFGSNIWYQKEAIELLPKGYTNPHSPNNLFTKEEDTMDVWFDSGTSFNILNGKQSDIYLEGSDQYRGWFNSSLINSVATRGYAPYKKVVSHGFVLDGEGQKMSKSLGNVIDPNKVSSVHGADVFRIWAATVDYEGDVRLSEDLLKQASESYRKIRNTFKYMLGNLFDFDKNHDYIGYSMRGKINRVMTLKLINVVNEVLKYYEEFNFERVVRTIMPFVINDLSAFYLDFTKDTLYILDENDFERRSVQSTIYDILMALLKVLTPIIPHTTSEVYSYLNQVDKEDVYLESMPKVNNFNDEKLMSAFKLFSEVREVVLVELERARADKVIGKSLFGALKIKLTKEHLDAIKYLEIDPVQVLMVASIDFELGNKIEVEVSLSNRSTCSRCWNLVEEINEVELCKRCQAVLEKKGK